MTTLTPLQGGMFYHVYNRGNNRENLFKEARNYSYFLDLYTKYLTPVVDTYAYCLLRNHFHLLIRVKTDAEQHQAGLREPLSASFQFGHCFNAYAKAINKAYNRVGSLFAKPFRRRAVTSAAYFQHLIVYIHRNPVHHGFVSDFAQWPYSSYAVLLSQKAMYLQRAAVLSWFGGREALVAAHRETALIDDALQIEVE